MVGCVARSRSREDHRRSEAMVRGGDDGHVRSAPRLLVTGLSAFLEPEAPTPVRLPGEERVRRRSHEIAIGGVFWNERQFLNAELVLESLEHHRCRVHAVRVEHQSWCGSERYDEKKGAAR